MLTNLPNRHYLYEIKQKWEHKESPFAVLFMDVDNFKGVNDTYGHPFGDKLLQEIANRLQHILDSDDTVVRQGGDEFIVLTTKQGETLEKFAQRINQHVHQPINIDGITLHTYISIGIAQFIKDATCFDDLLRKADLALYHCKESKKGFTFFDSILETTSKRFYEIEESLKSPNLLSQLYLVLQPQIAMSTQSIHGFEALIRWEHPKLGTISPDEFITIAEQTAEINKIGSFVRKQALHAIATINTTFNTHYTVSINASIDELLDDRYVADLTHDLEQFGVPANSICIEITESQLMRSVDAIIQVLNRIKSLGASISLDDFGTGYSSLSLLSTLPIDELKIDKSFIRNMMQDKNAMLLTSSIIKIAQEFNFQTVAEGIEEFNEIGALQSLACNIAQGYYYCKPQKLDALLTFIQQFNQEV